MRRTREEILVGILAVCIADNVPFTRLMFKLNLSYKLMKSYLSHLYSLSLIKFEEIDGKKSVATTDHGSAVLKCYRNAIAMLSGHASSCPLVHDYVIEQKPRTVF